MFIRTKDNKIYKIISEAKEEFAKNYDIDMLVEEKEGKKFYLGKKELKGSRQADTIEELCDRYYGVDKEGDIDNVYNWSKDAYPIKPHEWAINGFCTKENIEISELKKIYPKGIFGAVVWFDYKGNLHIDIVAKMNEKGVLELL